MRISLKQWKAIEQAIGDARKALTLADTALLDVYMEYPEGSPERGVLQVMLDRMHPVQQALACVPDCHVQSEWTGGTSDDPKNHRLREPNICPSPRRKFTPNEIKEAGAVCHGPCLWTFDGASSMVGEPWTVKHDVQKGAPTEMIQDAQQVLKILPGSGWHYRIHENLGWHVGWYNGPLSLSRHVHDGTWWTLMTSDLTHTGCGEVFWTPRHKRFPTPTEAVQYQLDLAASFMSRCRAAVDMAAKATGLVPRPILMEDV